MTVTADKVDPIDSMKYAESEISEHAALWRMYHNLCKSHGLH